MIDPNDPITNLKQPHFKLVMISALYEASIIESKKNGDNEIAQLDAFRTVLEPYIYLHLMGQYGSMLQQHWNTYLPPKQSEHVYVIVERRPHPHFQFILQNIAWAAPHMAVYLFCSDENRAFIEAILGDKRDAFNIIEIFKGDVSREAGKNAYNDILTNYTFYEFIPAKYILTVQMDNIFRRKLSASLFTGDYWGAPWGWKTEKAGGGGATVRRVSAMIALCKQHRPDCSIPLDTVEDDWISDKIPVDGYPDFETRRNSIMESVPSDHPYILHQPWTFMKHYLHVLSREHFLVYWGHLLTFEL